MGSTMDAVPGCSFSTHAASLQRQRQLPCRAATESHVRGFPMSHASTFCIKERVRNSFIAAKSSSVGSGSLPNIPRRVEIPLGNSQSMNGGCFAGRRNSRDGFMFGIEQRMHFCRAVLGEGSAMTDGEGAGGLTLEVPPGISPFAEEFSEVAAASVVVVVGEGVESPFGEATSWEQVMRHMARRINWVDESVECLVFSDAALQPSSSSHEKFLAAARDSDVLVGVAIQGSESAQKLLPFLEASQNCICFDSDEELRDTTRLNGQKLRQWPLWSAAAAKLGVWKEGAEYLKTIDVAQECWQRRNADDVWFALLVLVNAGVKPIAALQNLRAQGQEEVACMVGNCRDEIVACLLDESCRGAISCLNSCGPTDQVCSYRCIVSYESPQLEAFSLCVLQKNNCLNLSAEIRPRPQVSPMKFFRGQPLTHKTAEDIFVGHLGKLEWSWRVVAGQNAAYDQFPCQYQIFYRGKARGSVWYDPVFTVKLLDGRSVWRRRHYRVRRKEAPGTFTFSVLDNGVISEEYWRIVDAPDDLSWGLFYYSGAARAAGQSYTGAVLVSMDGQWPAEDQEPRLLAALAKCGIEIWELYRVDNSSCQGAPLGLPEDAPKPNPIV